MSRVARIAWRVFLTHAVISLEKAQDLSLSIALEDYSITVNLNQCDITHEWVARSITSGFAFFEISNQGHRLPGIVGEQGSYQDGGFA